MFGRWSATPTIIPASPPRRPASPSTMTTTDLIRSSPMGPCWAPLQLESYADEASGMSGGPLFSWFEDGSPYAIGVHKGREVFDYGPFGVDRNSVASGGALLNGMVRWARNTSGIDLTCHTCRYCRRALPAIARPPAPLLPITPRPRRTVPRCRPILAMHIAPHSRCARA